MRLEAFEEGGLGWAACERTLVGGQTFVLRVTLVLRLESSVWKVIQIHFSFASPDEEVLNPIDLPESLSDLLDSLSRRVATSQSVAVPRQQSCSPTLWDRPLSRKKWGTDDGPVRSRTTSCRSKQ